MFFIMLLYFYRFRVILGPPETPKRGAPVPFFSLWGRLGRDLGPSLGILEGLLGDKASKMPPRVPKTSPRGPQTSPNGPPDPPKPPKWSPRYPQRASKKQPQGPSKEKFEINFRPCKNFVIFYIWGSTISEVLASTVL